MEPQRFWIARKRPNRCPWNSLMLEDEPAVFLSSSSLTHLERRYLGRGMDVHPLRLSGRLAAWPNVRIAGSKEGSAPSEVAA
jgi:hypothetical protein